jgi:hypothetical protein
MVLHLHHPHHERLMVPTCPEFLHLRRLHHQFQEIQFLCF